MKKIISYFLLLLISAQVFATDKTITNLTAGSLASHFTVGEPETITSLTIAGEMDARDFRFIRDSMSSMTTLDLKNVSVLAYTGSGGTVMEYRNNDWVEDEDAVYNADEIPTNFLNDRSISTELAFTIPSSVKSIALSAFHASTLSQIIFPENCLLEKIEDEAFRGAELIYIDLPKSVKYIGRNQFFKCEKLERADLSDLEMDVIPRLIFADCNNLSYVIFSEHVDSIGNQAFQAYGQYAMDTVVIQSVHPPKLGLSVFDYSDTYGKPHLIVPQGSETAYIDAGYDEWFVITGEELSHPSITAITANVDKQMTVLWNTEMYNDKTAQPEGYYLLISTKVSPDWASEYNQIDSIYTEGKNTESLTFDLPDYDSEYILELKLFASNSNGSSSSFSLSDMVIPSAPEGNLQANEDSLGVKLTWESTEDSVRTTFNRIYKSINSSSDFSFLDRASSSDNSYSDGNVLSGTTYRYKLVKEIVTSGDSVFMVELPFLESNIATVTTGSDVGIDDISSLEEQINVYPNPTNGILNIENNNSNAEVRMYSINGELLLKEKSKQLNISRFANGIYIIQVGEKLIKVVKE